MEKTQRLKILWDCPFKKSLTSIYIFWIKKALNKNQTYVLRLGEAHLILIPLFRYKKNNYLFIYLFMFFFCRHEKYLHAKMLQHFPAEDGVLFMQLIRDQKRFIFIIPSEYCINIISGWIFGLLPISCN